MLRRLVLVSLLAAALAALAGTAGGAPQRYSGFRTPSGNIGCGYLPAEAGSPAYLRCDIRSGLRPRPRGRCELDWTGVGMGLRTPGRPVCAGDTVFDPRFPVLGYGRAWRKDGIVCFSETIGLICASAAGHGLFLARDAWRTF